VRLDALIFDLDGTLADSLADIGTSMNEMLRERGLPPHPLDAYKQFVGEGAEQLVERAVLGAGGKIDNLRELVDVYRQRYHALNDKHSVAYAGIEAMLEGAVSRGIKLAVLSNKRDDFTRRMVKQLFGRFPFADVRGEREGVPRKPDPTAAWELSLALNTVPARIGFVGDTKIDMQTAVNAGMHGIGVLWGFRDADELKTAGAKVLLEKPADLLALL
jgi:phosphoglycolate phosphatase